IAVLKNIIALLKLSMRSSAGRNFVLYMVDDEQLVHHNFVAVEEANRIVVVEEMLKTVGYTMVGCTVECCKLELEYVNWKLKQVDLEIFSSSFELY
nr:hypothetical protein [Tanacetum cinerariifolium]